MAIRLLGRSSVSSIVEVTLMAGQRSMTDVEMRAFEKQRKEARRALVALVLLVGGLSSMAIFLAASSRGGRSDERSIAKAMVDVPPAPPSKATPASEPTESRAALFTNATSAEPRPGSSASSSPGLPATAEDIRRTLRAQKQSSVVECIERAGRRSAKKSPKITVKLDLKPPDKVARLDVVATPKSPALVKCVKAKLRDLSVPKVASGFTVSVAFKAESAKGRRLSR